jgi:outer membrane protein OmpA-like peptidoglycan-associated protein
MLRSSRRAGTLAIAASLALFAVYTASAQSPPPGARVYPVHFPTGSDKLDAADEDTVRGVAASMQHNPELIATIIGKADTVGSTDFNEKLSQRRGEAVFNALVYTNHVPENRVELRWTGERLPYLSTEDEKEENLNRVVEIFVR